MGGILQTSHRSSHTSIILSATPTASRINGTGMKAAADCNTFKVSFPTAMKYCKIINNILLLFPEYIRRRYKDKRAERQGIQSVEHYC